MPLPSQECYNIMQDSKGYIWFSTEAGLCKYNGSSLEVFDKRNGLPEGSTYAVTEDEAGTLWFATSKNRILTYKDGNLKEASFSKSYSEKLKGTLELSYLLNFDPKGKLHINSGSRSFQWDESRNELKELNKPDTNATFYLEQFANGLIPVNGGFGQTLSTSQRKVNKGNITIITSKDNKNKEILFPFPKDKYPYWRILTAHAADADFFAFENYVFSVNADLSYTVFTYPDRVHQLFCDKDNGLWVGLRKNGVYYYPNSNDLKEPMICLQEYSVTGICEDKEKGIWCTTLEKGVFYCTNKDIISYANISDLNKRSQLLKYEDRKIFTVTGDNELFVFDNEKITRKEFPGKEIYTISGVLKLNKGWLLCSKTKLFKTNEQFNPASDLKAPGTQFNAGAYEAVMLKDERVFLLQYSIVSELIGEDIRNRTVKGFESAGQCMITTSAGKLLVGTKEYLYEFDPSSYRLIKINGLEGEVTGLIETKRNEIWICTKSSGLYLLKQGKLFNKTTELGLDNIRLFDIEEDKNGNVWLGGNTGLIQLIPKRKNFSAKIYTTLNGLPSNEVYKVAASHERIYISTYEGLSSFPLTADLNNTAVPAVFINTFFVNDKAIDFTLSPLLFEYNQNSMNITLDGLTFKGNTNKFAYRLNGEKDSLKYIEGNQLILNNLEAGAYELTAYAVNNSGLLSKNPVVIKFEIAKPFWKTIGFISGCIIILSLLVYVVVRSIIKGVKKKEEEKTKINKQIAEYQLTALQAQMNPHFIFNAINSIQGYILKKNEQQAYDYLAKFSKLIRMVLNHSQEKVLPLKQELEMLTLYVELEQLRFEESFAFDLKVDENVNVFELQVPTMLIQPYVENAIWHGLMNLDKNKKGNLKIHIGLKDELLKVVVEDNGIGRALAETFKKDMLHNSIGMKLTEQRLVMINKLQDYEGSKIDVCDLYDAEKNASGTRVEIFIPTSP